jgi:hypothetical protein
MAILHFTFEKGVGGLGATEPKIKREKRMEMAKLARMEVKDWKCKRSLGKNDHP